MSVLDKVKMSFTLTKPFKILKASIRSTLNLLCFSDGSLRNFNLSLWERFFSPGKSLCICCSNPSGFVYSIAFNVKPIQEMARGRDTPFKGGWLVGCGVGQIFRLSSKGNLTASRRYIIMIITIIMIKDVFI